MTPREMAAASQGGFVPSGSMAILTPSRRIPVKTTALLPVELIGRIVDFLPVSSQLRFARTSSAMRELVYDDSRWVIRLQSMGAWNEEEARRAAEEDLAARKLALERAKEEAVLGRRVTDQRTRDSTTIFDANVEAMKLESHSTPTTPQITEDLLDLSLDTNEAFGEFQSTETETATAQDSVSPFHVLDSVVSRRGQARSEFGKVYTSLAPLYNELTDSNSLEDASAFRHRRMPEDRAKLLHILELFGRTRSVDEWTRREKRMNWIIEMFERQMIVEFEEGYDAQDFDGKMRKYAFVLHELNGGDACMRSFANKHPSMFYQKENPMACLTYPLFILH
jgi:recyclin-1